MVAVSGEMPLYGLLSAFYTPFSAGYDPHDAAVWSDRATVRRGTISRDHAEGTEQLRLLAARLKLRHPLARQP